MPIALSSSDTPEQKLPREAYISQDWLEQERSSLFANSWYFAGVVSDFAEVGDYRTVRGGNYPLVVLKDRDGDLRGFHNLCRHRGTELLEGSGNAGKSIICPYHFWTYNLDGQLRGVPKQAECFPDLDKKSIQLREAAIGIYNGLVFVNPQAKSKESFEAWLANLPELGWPHDVNSPDLQEFDGDVVYEIKCNWKVLFENAIDGYHLAYLHKNTLGGPLADKNVWEATGRHMIWYSTERDGHKNRVPEYVERQADSSWTTKIKGAEEPGYGGVYMLFPCTIVTPSPWSITISSLEPVDANTTLMRARSWSPKGWLSYREKVEDIPGYDKESGIIKSSNWTMPPLETGDFQTEDIWICEKMQRSLQSPSYSISALAHGAGGEAPLTFFQQCVVEALQEKPEQ